MQLDTSYFAVCSSLSVISSATDLKRKAHCGQRQYRGLRLLIQGIRSGVIATACQVWEQGSFSGL